MLKKQKTNTNPRKRSKTNSQEFKKVLAEIESPQDWGNGSWALPENASTSEKVKYELCEKVIKYKRNKQFTTEKLAQKIQLSKAETEDILYCRIDYFTLDRLVEYATRLFKPLEIKMVIERKTNKISFREQTV